MQLIMTIFALIDYFIYTMVSKMFSLIFLIAEVDIFDEGTISMFSNRIYGVLGVIILFKIVISCIQYLVNPDKMVDKDKGMGKLLTRTIISIALLALVPTIFKFAKNAQTVIANAIPTIIIGRDLGSSDDDIEEAGKWMAFQTLTTFIEAKPDKTINNSEYINDFESFISNITAGCGFFEPSKCKYTYQFVFSIPVGIFMLYILLSMGIDIAIRSIKLGILQLLAPIPISSYINSEEKFTKWYKLCFDVYADLFIRLIIIYFVVFLIDIIANGGVSIGDNMFVWIYMIIAILMFAKEAPKFISKALGIEGDGMGGIADMFKPVWSRGGFAALGGMATAGAANFVNKGKSVVDNVNKANGVGAKLRAAAAGALSVGASTVAGATSAGLHGGLAALQGKNGKEVMAAGHKRAVTARQNRELDKANNVGTWDRVTARTQDFLGLDTDASLAEGRQKAYATLHQDVGNFKKAVMGRITKTANVAMVEGSGSASSMLGELLARNMDAINASGNQDLINYTQKFNISRDASGKWVSTGLKSGEHISYHDLAAITADATQSGIGSISSLTGENGALTLQAQKELFSASMSGKITDINGNSILELNVGNEKTHVDISTAVGTAKQHIAENSVSLGKIDAKAVYRAPDGTIKVATENVPIVGEQMIINAFETDFGKLDDQIQKESAKLSTKMSQDPNAAARASMQRRDNNKKS